MMLPTSANFRDWDRREYDPLTRTYYYRGRVFTHYDEHGYRVRLTPWARRRLARQIAAARRS